jgi:palmitoyltransferase
VEEFKKRHEEDLKRQASIVNSDIRRRAFHKREDLFPERNRKDTPRPESEESGEEGWRNSEGERLEDFGVDELAEFYDEDEQPLSELIRRRQMSKANGGSSTSALGPNP